MRFKLLGIVLLAAGLYLVGDGVLGAHEMRDATAKPITYCLAGIFLAITVRVLQAERHHRVEIQTPRAETAPPVTRVSRRELNEDMEQAELG
jgi:hypothetical protein